MYLPKLGARTSRWLFDIISSQKLWNFRSKNFSLIDVCGFGWGLKGVGQTKTHKKYVSLSISCEKLVARYLLAKTLTRIEPQAKLQKLRRHTRSHKTRNFEIYFIITDKTVELLWQSLQYFYLQVLSIARRILISCPRAWLMTSQSYANIFKWIK